MKYKIKIKRKIKRKIKIKFKIKILEQKRKEQKITEINRK